MSQSIVINRMPVRVWRRPRVNEIEVLLNPAQSIASPESFVIENPEELMLSRQIPETGFKSRGADYFVPEELSAFIAGSAAQRHHIRIPRGYAQNAPLVITCRLSKAAPVQSEELYIEAEEGSKACVIIKYYGEDGTPAEHTGITRVTCAPGSELHLIKLQSLNKQATHTDAVEAIVDAKASLTITMAELGAAVSNASCSVQLAGESAQLKLDVLYLGDGDRKLDMTYWAEHRGKKTLSDIKARGILHGTSHKVLRDTLDFVKGASGSKGREEESVLLLGSKARNISVPLLLCGEHDVEGAHAASSGRLDEDVMFYILSRGISEEDARKLVAKASFDVILEDIPDERIREEIMAAVEESIDRGGK